MICRKILKLASQIKLSETSQSWLTYKKEHPATKKTEKDFLEGLKDDSEDPEEELELDTDDTPENDTPKKTELKNNALDPDIDSEDLNEALDDILGDKEYKDIGERLEALADKLVEIVDIDQYIEKLPDKAKALAQHVRETEKKKRDHVERLISKTPNTTYEKYVAEMKKRKEPFVEKVVWNDLHKKEIKKPKTPEKLPDKSKPTK